MKKENFHIMMNVESVLGANMEPGDLEVDNISTGFA